MKFKISAQSYTACIRTGIYLRSIFIRVFFLQQQQSLYFTKSQLICLAVQIFLKLKYKPSFAKSFPQL